MSKAMDGDKGNLAFISSFWYKLFFGVTKKIIKVFFIEEWQFLKNPENHRISPFCNP